MILTIYKFMSINGTTTFDTSLKILTKFLGLFLAIKLYILLHCGKIAPYDFPTSMLFVNLGPEILNIRMIW